MSVDGILVLEAHLAWKKRGRKKKNGVPNNVNAMPSNLVPA